jgi:fatty-acyl-CoA synthase
MGKLAERGIGVGTMLIEGQTARKTSPATALDAEAIRKFCQDRISHYKITPYIRFVESFPSTVTGKVQKFATREAVIEEFADAAKVRA